MPRSLRECDLTLKIRQWHDTCWQSGYLTTRCQGNKVNQFLLKTDTNIDKTKCRFGKDTIID